MCLLMMVASQPSSFGSSKEVSSESDDSPLTHAPAQDEVTISGELPPPPPASPYSVIARGENKVEGDPEATAAREAVGEVAL